MVIVSTVDRRLDVIELRLSRLESRLYELENKDKVRNYEDFEQL